MTVWEAALLGLVQGVFMFVPVSSTSHLVLVQHWLIARGSALPPPASAEMILFDLVVHVGTVVSIAVVLRHSLGRLARGASRDVRALLGRHVGRSGRYLRLCGLGLLSVAATGAVGLLVRAYGTGVFAHPTALSVTLAGTGLILWWTDTAGPRWRGLQAITPLVALGVGLAQAVALLPGFSRSGLTIAFALFVGLRRRWAAEYSFFVAIPTILAASGLQSLLVLRAAEPIRLDAAAFGTGFAVAAVAGVMALKLVLTLLYRARFRYFSYYVFALAGGIAAAALLTG